MSFLGGLLGIRKYFGIIANKLEASKPPTKVSKLLSQKTKNSKNNFRIVDKPYKIELMTSKGESLC